MSLLHVQIYLMCPENLVLFCMQCLETSLSGVSDRQLEETFTGQTTTLCLPSAGDWVVVIATALISVTELFVQLPLGCTNPLQLSKDDDDSFGKGCMLVSNVYKLGVHE